jgi:hypothetical protein
VIAFLIGLGLGTCDGLAIAYILIRREARRPWWRS